MGQNTLRAIMIALILFFVGTGCSKKEAPVSPSGQAFPGSAEGEMTAGNSPGDIGTVPESSEAGQPFRVSGISVHIYPTFPSRMSPPLLILKGAPSETDWEFREIVWFVNEMEYPGKKRMDPEWFQKGDRIRARGVLRNGAEEVAFETREIVARNCPPEMGDVRLEPKAPTTGSKVSVVAVCDDPDGDPVTMKYKWFVDDKEVPGEEGTELTLAGVKKGSWVHVKVSTSDGTTEGSWKYSPRYKVVNSLPVVKSALPAEVPPDRKFSYQIEAEDPDGDMLSYTLVKSPEGMVLSGSTLLWDVPDDILGKMVEVVVNISDGDGGQTICTLSMNIRKPQGPNAPLSARLPGT